MFIGRTDAEAETPILWPPHARVDSLEKTLDCPGFCWGGGLWGTLWVPLNVPYDVRGFWEAHSKKDEGGVRWTLDSQK